MGNSRLNKPEQAAAPLTLAGKENSDDLLRSEVFTPQDRKTMSATELTRKLEELIDHLEKASELARKGDMEGATRAYATAIGNAEDVDQVSVARERRNLKQALKDKDLSPSERRELLQRDANLHTLERAPGFALANYALMLIRSGDQFNGTKLLVRAQERDREMVEDPNFKRHLKLAIEDGEPSGKATITRVSADLPPGFPQPTIPNPARPAETYTPPNPVAKPFVPQQTQTFAPQQTPPFVPQQTQTFAPQQTPPFVPQQTQTFAPQQPGYRGPSDVQPVQYSPPGATRPDAPIPTRPEEARGTKISPLDAQGHTPIEAAAVLYAQVVKDKTISPAIYQQFMQAIANADAGISPRFQPFVQKQIESAKTIESFAATHPNIIAAVVEMDNSASALIDRVQPQQKLLAAQLYNQLDRVGTQKERDDVQAQLIAMNPAFKQFLQQRDQAIGPELKQILMNNAQVQAAIEKQFQNKDNQAEFNQAAITRFTFALALEKANRPDEARAMMAHAISTNNSQDAAQNEFWKKTAARMGVHVIDDPARKGDAPQQNPAGAKGIEAKPTGNAAEHVMYNVQKFKEAIDGGANAASVFTQMKPQFEQAIGKADAEFEAVMKKVPQVEKLSAELAAQPMLPDARAKSLAFAKQIGAEKEQMTPEIQELAKKFQNTALPDAERNALRAQLTQVAPKFVELTDQFEKFSGKEYVAKLNQVVQDEHEINNAIAGRFVTRLAMAQCADKAGDTETVASKLVAGLAAVPGAYQKAYLQQKEVQVLADKVGLRQDQLPIPPDVILTRNDSTGEKAEKITVPGISEENQGSSPEHIMRHARQMLRTEGMSAATKKQFEDAIKVADFIYNKDDAKAAEKFVQWLKAGKTDNGQPITPAERAQYHAIIENTFVRATLGIQYRGQYAQLLLENKQQASAEKMHLERIKLADELPLKLFADELAVLSVDMRNKDLGRTVQDNLGVMFEQISGSGTSKEDGLLYMPIATRKQAVFFYMSKMEGIETGLFKPDHAIDMINETRAAEKRLYDVDLTKDPKKDAQLYAMAAKFEPFASEQLRKDKQRYDTYWSNGFIDAGVGAAALTGAAFLASLATKNPKYFAWALTGDKALTTTAKVGIGVLAFSGATATRSYLHQSATGQSEDLSTSMIHTTAGIAGIAGIVATRGLVNKILFRGATEEGNLLRVTEAYGKTVEGAVGGEKVLKVEQLGEFYVKNNIRLPQETVKWMAENKDVVVATGRTVNQAAFDMCKLGLNPAQSASLAKTLAPLAPLAEAGAAEGVASTSFLGKLGEKSAGGLKNIFMPVTKLDLATASTAQLNMRAFYGNWAQATGGIFALESVRSLDREINPETGKKYSYAESLWNANYVSADDNTVVRGLQLGVIAMGMGSVPKNFYAQDATLMGRIKGTMAAPFTASRFGATTANSTYFQQGLKAGYLGFASNMYDFRVLQKFAKGMHESNEAALQLQLNQRPIENLAPPGVKAIEIPQLAPTGGASGTAPPPHRENGDLKDEPPPPPKPSGQVDLTKGTPGMPSF